MKQRFNALDLRAALYELKSTFTGFRVANVYDVDNKTYLIKLSKPDSKAVILIESGIRIHGTSFDWPKNTIPSGFSMKLRKHLRSRRLEKVSQLGADRIVDLQFGSNEAAYHLIVELYDRGNILLTDHEYTIVSVLRPRTDENADTKFVVKEKYPIESVKQYEDITIERLGEIISGAKPNDELKKVLTSNLVFGPPLIEHCLAVANFPDKCLIGKNFDPDLDMERLFQALLNAQNIMNEISNKINKGYIVQKKTKKVKIEKSMAIEDEEVLTYEEFHPFLFKKHENASYLEFESFDKAVDEFFSKVESQKIEIREIQQNKEAIKKLENVKKDHQKRLEELRNAQNEEEFKARLIVYNLDLVDKAIYFVNNAIANQLDWKEIEEIIEEAKEENHFIAISIKKLKLEINHVVLLLSNPEDEEEDERKPVEVEIDLGLTAYGNSQKYYESKKSSLAKEQKTISASGKALKSAEKKTFEILKQASKTAKSIIKSRKTYWFEKFYWFISSENYLVIGGRDAQQNELIVKRYLKTGDLYVHADLHGASSVVIKNPSGNSVPPKTLNEAGCMAVCYSVAWEAKVLTTAYWVNSDQVSKQAPSGEYLTTGSFMIRGKKNYLPQTALVFGFGILYKLDDASIFRHKDERKVKSNEEEQIETMNALKIEEVEEEIEINDEKGDEYDEKAEPIDEDSNAAAVLSDGIEKVDEEESQDSDGACFPDTNFQVNLVSNIKKELIEKNADELNEIEKNQSGDEIEENEPNESDKNQSEKTESALARDGKGEKQKTDKKTESQEKFQKENSNNTQEKEAKAKNLPLKRGQKSRLNKMKKKYKDQDEEDKELVMKFLAPAGKESASKDSKKGKNQPVDKQKQMPKNVEKKTETKKPEKVASNPTELIEQDIEAEEEIKTVEAELDIIDSLTGLPVDDDEILFCLPVCAPYTAIQNYKHKVKLTPGTSKKGQALKTAIEIFVRDKETTTREKDLIRSNLTKEQDLTRNLPGKVKVSAPNLMKLKKK